VHAGNAKEDSGVVDEVSCREVVGTIEDDVEVPSTESGVRVKPLRYG
jgi:hypothetical protein